MHITSIQHMVFAKLGYGVVKMHNLGELGGNMNSKTCRKRGCKWLGGRVGGHDQPPSPHETPPCKMLGDRQKLHMAMCSFSRIPSLGRWELNQSFFFP